MQNMEHGYSSAVHTDDWPCDRQNAEVARCTRYVYQLVRIESDPISVLSQERPAQMVMRYLLRRHDNWAHAICAHVHRRIE